MDKDSVYCVKNRIAVIQFLTAYFILDGEGYWKPQIYYLEDGEEKVFTTKDYFFNQSDAWECGTNFLSKLLKGQ